MSSNKSSRPRKGEIKLKDIIFVPKLKRGKCPNCGNLVVRLKKADIHDGFVICPHCGYKLPCTRKIVPYEV